MSNPEFRIQNLGASSVCSDVSLFRNFVTVRPAHEKALSDGAEEASTKVRLPIRGNAITATNHSLLTCDQRDINFASLRQAS